MNRLLSQSLAVILALTLVTSGLAISDQKARTMPDVEPVGEAEGLAATSAVLIGVATGAAATGAYFEYVKDDINESAQQDQIHTDLYSQATGTAAKGEVLNDSMDNYLKDTESIALMEAKNSYIRYLNDKQADVATEAEARVAAKSAVADYYAKKQKTVIESWEAEVATAQYISETANNVSGMSRSTVGNQYIGGTSASSSGLTGWNSVGTEINLQDFGSSTSVTLVNGNSTTVDTVRVEWENDRGNYVLPSRFAGKDGTNTNKTKINAPFEYLEITPPQSLSGSSKVRLLEVKNYVDKWQKIDQQHGDVDAQIDQFVNGTYQNYQTGEINNSDLVDPYLGAREYEPDGSDTWGLRSLTSMGIEPPENTSNYGGMQITTQPGVMHDGLLMNDGANISSFEVGKTYNLSKLGGTQFVATDDGPKDISDKTITIRNVTRADGSEVDDGEKIKYTNIDYKTANITEYKNTLDELAETRAKLEAYRKNASSGGALAGLLPSDIGDMEILIGIGLLIGFMLIAGRDDYNPPRN